MLINTEVWDVEQGNKEARKYFKGLG